jgi:tetratricopeptide (TPR) repeat protein
VRWILAKAGVYSEQKKWDEAVNWLESCLQKNSDSREINLALIGVLFDKKSFRVAKKRIQPLLTDHPDDLMLLRFDSQLSISLGLHSDAVKVLTKVVETDPMDYTSINNLAWILSTSPIDSVRNGHRAVELAKKAGELTRYKRAFILSTLAAAYAEAGDFDKAREWSQQSVDVAKAEKGKTEEERQELLDHLQKEWDCFKQDIPFRELLDEDEEKR